MRFDLDISDSRWFDYLAEKAEQEADEKEYDEFYDEDWEMEDVEQWRD
jgi:hypothetical protein